MNQKCLIIGAGALSISREMLQSYIVAEGKAKTFVYCADGGIHNAVALNIKPDRLIGDLDSCSEDQEAILQLNQTDGILTLNTAKEETDLLVCAMEAIKAGFTECILICCSGGRLDHFMGALSVLEYLRQGDVDGILLDEQNEIHFLLPGVNVFSRNHGFPYISLLPIDSRISGVTFTGVKYPLLNETLSRESGRGISNEILKDEATLSIQTGKALLIRSRDK
jgi:thiamine pyrophosphokinase